MDIAEKRSLFFSSTLSVSSVPPSDLLVVLPVASFFFNTKGSTSGTGFGVALRRRTGDEPIGIMGLMPTGLGVMALGVDDLGVTVLGVRLKYMGFVKQLVLSICFSISSGSLGVTANPPVVSTGNLSAKRGAWHSARPLSHWSSRTVLEQTSTALALCLRSVTERSDSTTEGRDNVSHAPSFS